MAEQLFKNLNSAAVPQEAETDTPALSEFDLLKARARMMNIPFSNNISVETLRARIQARLASEENPDQNDPVDDDTESVPEDAAFSKAVEAGAQNQEDRVGADETGMLPDIKVVSPVKEQTTPVPAPTRSRPKTVREELLEREMALVRVRISNMDPKKADLKGEIFTVANEYLGTVRKFIPYGEQTDNGYHIPVCIYNQLKDRTFVNIRIRKGAKGQQIVESKDSKEFNLEVLPPLTASELAALAGAQSAASSSDDFA